MSHSSITPESSNRGQQSDRISRTVVEAVAEAEGDDPTNLTPLYTVVDPDALESLFQTQTPNPDGQVDGEIRFTYCGYEVRVTAAGEVDLADGSDR